jgi:hypothetical protein
MMAGSTPTTTNVLHGQNNFMWEKWEGECFDIFSSF